LAKHELPPQVRKALPTNKKTRKTIDVAKVDYTQAKGLLTEGAGMQVRMTAPEKPFSHYGQG
jgi:hypothetical protein